MENARLDSWKSIADYLQRSTRTVQRWHANHGLPVHHFRGPKGGAFAYPKEIDAWLPGLFHEKGNNPAEGGNEPNEGKRRSLDLTDVADGIWEIRSEKNISSISSLYREAIDEDPSNTAAYLGLANGMIFAALHGIVDGSMAYPSAEEALQRMSLLEPDSIGRKCTAAWLDLAWKRKWGKAGAEFDEVLCLGRGSSFALSGCSLLSIAEGNLLAASEYAFEAWKQNTLVPSLGAILCWIPYLAGDFEKSLQLVSEAGITGSYGATHAAIEALALIQTGSLTEHLKRLQGFASDYPHDRTMLGALGFSYAISDQPQKARETLAALGWKDSDKKTSSAYAASLVFIGLDKHQEAIQALETSYAAGSQWSLGFRFDPILKPLRNERRFRDFLRKAGPGPEKSAGKSVQENERSLA